MKETMFKDLLLTKDTLNDLIKDVEKENINQVNKWGIQTHSMYKWVTITAEEFGSIAKAILDEDEDRTYKEAIQVATLCLKIAEMIKAHKK